MAGNETEMGGTIIRSSNIFLPFSLVVCLIMFILAQTKCSIWFEMNDRAIVHG